MRLLVLLVTVDLLLATLDATQICLCRCRLLLGSARLSSITGSLMPHEARLRKLVSVSDNIVLDALSLVQTVLGDE